MIQSICVTCGKTFFDRKRGNRVPKFCSSICYGLSKKGKPSWNKGVPMREETKKILSEARKGKHLSPATEFKVGGKTFRSKNVNWRGGKWETYQGYIHILLPGHIRANVRGYVPEHVIIAEQRLGRALDPREVVHHINGVKADNRPENLFVFPSKTEHARHHMNILRGKEQGLTTNLTLD